MKAEIKVVNAEKIFNAAAKNMAVEHDNYYSVVPGIEAGMFVDGKSVGQRKRNENGWDKDYDFVSEILSGIDEWINVSWITSAGNMLCLFKDGTILVEGRRHEIPFWTLPEGWIESVEYYHYKTSVRRDLAPWERSNGQYCPITAEYVQVRVLGLPKESRNGDPANGIPADPTAPKTIYQSWVLADDMQKKFPVIWPSRDEKSDWILYKVMDKVLEGKWDTSTYTKKYLNQETHSDLFLRVFKNNNLKNPYEKGWMPKGMVVMNVIDRQRMAEHKEKKHTFILSKASEGTDKEGKTTEYFDGGVSNLVYDSLMSVVGTCGDYNEYDIVVKRTRDKPYYAVYHGTEKLRFADFAAFNPKTIEAPLTEEELSWERYDIDKLYPVTSYKIILAKLRQFFVQVDKEFGTRYLDELIHLAEIEARETPKEV